MLSLTHSAIDPGVYASTRRSQFYLLEQVGARPNDNAMLPIPPRVELDAARFAVAPEKKKAMVPTSVTRVGMLRVQGFEGITREHHAAHLTQMAVVGLADLAKRWSKPPRADLSDAVVAE